MAMLHILFYSFSGACAICVAQANRAVICKQATDSSIRLTTKSHDVLLAYVVKVCLKQFMCSTLNRLVEGLRVLRQHIKQGSAVLPLLRILSLSILSGDHTFSAPATQATLQVMEPPRWLCPAALLGLDIRRVSDTQALLI